jgi:CHAT domain-containing protein
MGRYGAPAACLVVLCIQGCTSGGEGGGITGSVDLAPKGEQVVYNAVFRPQFGLSRLTGDSPGRPVLRAGQSTLLVFGLGPRWVRSVLPPTKPNPEILSSKVDLPLSVIAFCDFCEAGGQRLQNIVFHPSEGRSDTASFPLVPKMPPGGARDYDASIRLLVLNNLNGREYDRLSIDVTVRQAAEQRDVPMELTPVWLSVGGLQRLQAQEPNADAVLTIVRENDGVVVALNPLAPMLRQRLQHLVLDANGAPLRFRTHAFDEEHLKSLFGGAFMEVSSISVQGALARDMRHSGGGAIVSDSSQKSLLLTDRERADVAKAIARYGRRLYIYLFLEGPDPNERKALSEAIAVLEQASVEAPKDRPFRLKIETDNLSLPWQYLISPGDDLTLNPDKFWGMRFSLTTIRADYSVPTVIAAPDVRATRVIFARYSVMSDDSWKLADAQIEELKNLHLSDVRPVFSREQLLDQELAAAERDKVGALITFLHAASGQELLAGPNSATLASSAAGPLLYFSADDSLQAGSLLDLKSKLSAKEIAADPRYLRGAPLVILNACETGASTVAVQFITLDQAMFELGAKAVIVTEVSVWTSLGHEVSMRLFAHLGEGTNASDSLTLVRREIYEKFHNPLGLLYAYYGDPQAVLRR